MNPQGSRSGAPAVSPAATRLPWSDELRAMLRPGRAYRALAEETDDAGARRALAGKLVRLFAVLGAFVSLTAAGRLVAAHLLFTLVFWSFVPMLQTLFVAAVVRVLAPKEPLVRALALYFAGTGPWYLFVVIVSGICLFAPDVYAAMMKLLGLGILPGLLVVALAWSMVLTWAFFRHGLALARGRAWAATLLFYLGFIGAIVGYFYVTDQIRPQFFWTGS